MRLEAKFRPAPAIAQGLLMIIAGIDLVYVAATEKDSVLIVMAIVLALFVVPAGITSLLRAGRVAVVIDDLGFEVLPQFLFLSPLSRTVRVPWSDGESWRVSVWGAQVLFENRILLVTLQPWASPELWRNRGMLPRLFRIAPAWRGKVVVFLGRLNQSPLAITQAFARHKPPVVSS